MLIRLPVRGLFSGEKYLAHLFFFDFFIIVNEEINTSTYTDIYK